MRITIHKRLVAILMAAVLLASAAVGVSADDQYVPFLGNGWAWYANVSQKSVPVGYTVKSFNGNSSVFFYDYFGASFKSGFTYVYQHSMQYSSALYSKFKIPSYRSTLYYVNTLHVGSYYSFTGSSTGAVITVEDGGNGYYTLQVVINLDKMELIDNDYYFFVPLFYCDTQSNSYSYSYTDAAISMVSDPDGTYFDKLYSEYLSDIRDQLHAGDDYTPPDSAASSLDSSVDGLTSAEGALKDKSSSLMDSVDSQMTENVAQAKALVTTLNPAAVQVNNIYNSFLTVLPAEVKAMFIAIPLLLFVGWLVGRIRE